MPDDVSDIQAYYTDYDEDSRLGGHQLERDVTLRYLEQYLPPSASVLEMGAATGAYTLWLAQRGHRVTAVDLCRPLLEQCRRRIAEAGLEHLVDCHAADVRELPGLDREGHDAVLLMGPLYHLVLREDRLRALRESYRRLRLGGLLFSAHISRLGCWSEVLRDDPTWIEHQREVWSLVASGCEPDDMPRGGWRAYYASAEEVAPLHEEVGIKTLVLAGVEPIIGAHDESYNRLTGKQRKLWGDLLFELSREPSMVASSRHLLYIGRKHEPGRQVGAEP
jgi:S-adenosylmethionine-dependent methyltransferase